MGETAHRARGSGKSTPEGRRRDISTEPPTRWRKRSCSEPPPAGEIGFAFPRYLYPVPCRGWGRGGVQGAGYSLPLLMLCGYPHSIVVWYIVTAYIAVGLLAGLGSTILVILGLAVAFVRHADALIAWASGYIEGSVQPFESRLKALEALVDDLPVRWDEIRDEAQKIKARAHYHVKRARSELAEIGLEDPELEGLDGQLRLIDDGRSEEEGMRSVPEGVVGVPEASQVESWQLATMRHKYGNR